MTLDCALDRLRGYDGLAGLTVLSSWRMIQAEIARHPQVAALIAWADSEERQLAVLQYLNDACGSRLLGYQHPDDLVVAACVHVVAARAPEHLAWLRARVQQNGTFWHAVRAVEATSVGKPVFRTHSVEAS